MGRHRLGKVRLDNNVNDNELGEEKGAERKTALRLLPNLQLQADEAQLIADDIVGALGDQHSRPFYTLVAMKIPENVIRQKLAEIKQGGVLASKSFHQCHEDVRHHQPAEAGNLRAHVGDANDVQDIGCCSFTTDA